MVHRRPAGSNQKLKNKPAAVISFTPFQPQLGPVNENKNLHFFKPPVLGSLRRFLRLRNPGGFGGRAHFRHGINETDNTDLFLDGNPAGLLLLDTHDRLDWAGQWAYSNTQPSGFGSTQQTFGTAPRFSNDSVIRYEGLMVFPDPHWAFQLAGDFLYPQGQTAGNYSADTFSTRQYRELIRAAYGAGPFSFGLEVSNVEEDNFYDPGLFSASGGTTIIQSSGSNGENKTHVRTGLVASFPDHPEKDEPRWQVGGIFETQLGSDLTQFEGERDVLGAPPFSLQQDTSLTQYYYFGPELRYEVPGRLILKFYSFITNDYTNFSESASPPNANFPDDSPYVSSQFQSMVNFGAFRMTLPAAGSENLKLGGSLTATLTNTNLLGPLGHVTDNQNRQQINGTLGIGLESPGHSLWGLQFSSQNFTHDNEKISAKTLTSNDYDLYQIALGGEKWLSTPFALRAGLVVEEDVYNLNTGLNTLTTSLTTGFGLQEKRMKLDTKFILGSGFGLNGSGSRTLLLGAEIQGTFFL